MPSGGNSVPYHSFVGRTSAGAPLMSCQWAIACCCTGAQGESCHLEHRVNLTWPQRGACSIGPQVQGGICGVDRGGRHRSARQRCCNGLRVAAAGAAAAGRRVCAVQLVQRAATYRWREPLCRDFRSLSGGRVAAGASCLDHMPAGRDNDLCWEQRQRQGCADSAGCATTMGLHRILCRRCMGGCGWEPPTRSLLGLVAVSAPRYQGHTPPWRDALTLRGG